MPDTINLTLKIWRQARPESKGRLETYRLKEIDTNMSFLEMLDTLNERLIHEGKDPVAFDHDCREGICGTCGAMVNGQAHGPLKGTTLCQTHMRHFKNNQTIVIEPWRAKGFPVVKDLVVDRFAFDRIMASGGYVSVKTGSAPDAHDLPVRKEDSDEAMDAAACIGCGACVAACPNAAAMLFTAAKVSQLSRLPQGEPEKERRAINMVRKMDEEGFGNCSNEYLCEAACPKEISVAHIARLNREYGSARVSAKSSG